MRSNDCMQLTLQGGACRQVSTLIEFDPHHPPVPTFAPLGEPSRCI